MAASVAVAVAVGAQFIRVNVLCGARVTDQGLVKAGIVNTVTEALRAGNVDYLLFDCVVANPPIKLVDDAAFFEVGLLVPGEACGPAGEGDAVVAGEAQPLLEELERLIGAKDWG